MDIALALVLASEDIMFLNGMRFYTTDGSGTCVAQDPLLGLGIFSRVAPFAQKSMSLAPCQFGASAVNGNANDCRMFTRALAERH